MVTYDIADDVEVSVYHDHFSMVENPSVHSVFPGTRIHVSIADLQNGSEQNVIASVNDKDMDTDNEGNLFAFINENSVVSIKNNVTAISSTIVDSDEHTVRIFNLQGIPVSTDVNTLPAGIYIINGKKTRLM